MKVIVNYADSRWEKFNLDFNAIANLVGGQKHQNCEVSIILTNDKQIQELNKKYRGRDAPTNVLSFESGDDVLLGDIYISIDTVMKESGGNKAEFINHTIHMTVHGILHLLGFDHLNKYGAWKMERFEIKILKKLGIKNPYKSDKKICVFDKLKSDKVSWTGGIIFFILGLISCFGFAPFNLWFLTIFAIGTGYYFYFNVNSKQSFWCALIKILPFTAGYALGMFWWMLNSIYVVPELAAQFAIWTLPALFGVGFFGGIVFAVPFVLIRCIRTDSASRAILFAAIWTFVLWLREWFLTGFPWNPIANLSLPMPVISNSMSVFGALGLTFIIIGLIASISEFFINKKQSFWSLCIFIKLILFAAVLGCMNLKKSEIENESPIIRIVQPAKSGEQKATHSRAEAIANAEKNIVDLVNLASTPGKYDFIVFPETSYPYMVYREDLDFVKKLKTPVITGALSYKNRGIYNSLVITDSAGKIQKIYSKSHLVPFGEYRPFGNIIPTPGQLESGGGAEVLNVQTDKKDFNFVPAICYEIIFSDSLVPRGGHPNAIINITNDTWFGKTPGTYQHLDMVRRYAIESGLPIVRANYSGISAFIESNGNVKSMLPIGYAGVLDGTVSGEHMTIYRRLGRDNIMIIILLFSIICSAGISVFQKKD